MWAAETRVQLTGNPFVDTGLGVIATLARLDDISELRMIHAREVHGDGARLAAWNTALNCFTAVFTKNSLLTNSSIKKESRKPAYVAVVNALLNSIGAEDLELRCQACGSSRSVDLDALCRRAIPADIVRPRKRFVGRDWFPLAGSLGSDAQALAMASEPVHLCARCLFAVQYLPMGLVRLGRQLAVFQSTSVAFWQAIARSIAEEVFRRANAGNYETIGTKEGTGKFVLRLLELFERLQHATAFKDIPAGTSLLIWRFSNAKTSECSVEEIPNASLTFLWQAARLGKRDEVAELIRNEGKRERSLLNCIVDGSDYAGLYPRGRSQGVSPNLFCLYQESVCGRQSAALKTATRIANSFAKNASAAEVTRTAREGAFDEAKTRNAFRFEMIKAAERGELSVDEYQALFPTSMDQGTWIEWDGWKLIRYFLNHLDFTVSRSPKPAQSETATTIQYYASKIFRNYTANHGLEAFRRNVLEAFQRRRISVTWVQGQFTRLAEIVEGFSWSYWVLVFGHPPAVAEPLFQMRLLWSEWSNSQSPEDGGRPPLTESSSLSGLDRPVEEALRIFFTAYCTNRGPDRFHRDVLLRLNRREVGLQSLNEWVTKWGINKKAEFSSEWEKSFPDQGDNAETTDFIFRVRLLLANLYRIEQQTR